MPAHLDLAVLVALYVVAISLGSHSISLSEKTTSGKNSITINDVLYLESKDVLLQMLEKKLKEIKDHKKRKPDAKNANGNILPRNVDFKLKSNGISAVGDAELLLRYGKNGQGAVNLTADGISNVGKVQLTVGIGENGIHIPGLNNLFAGPVFKSDDKNDAEQLPHVVSLNSGFRRQSNISNVTNTADKLEGAAEVDEANDDDEAVNVTTSTSSTSIILAPAANDVRSDALNGNANVTVALNQTVAIKSIAANTNSAAVVSSDTVVKSDAAPVNTESTNGQNINAV